MLVHCKGLVQEQLWIASRDNVLAFSLSRRNAGSPSPRDPASHQFQVYGCEASLVSQRASKRRRLQLAGHASHHTASWV